MRFIEFFNHLIKIKDVKRTGWLYKDIPNPESVADHTAGVAMLALTTEIPENVDRYKLLKMAIVHDFSEAIIGDVVWESGNYKNIKKRDEKHVDETKAIQHLFGLIDNKDLEDLAIEFLEQKTPTAKFLKELDKLEMIFQAFEYEKKVHPSKLDEFWVNVKNYIKYPSLKKILVDLEQRRIKS